MQVLVFLWLYLVFQLLLIVEFFYTVGCTLILVYIIYLCRVIYVIIQINCQLGSLVIWMYSGFRVIWFYVVVYRQVYIYIGLYISVYSYMVIRSYMGVYRFIYRFLQVIFVLLFYVGIFSFFVCVLIVVFEFGYFYIKSFF